MIALLVLVLLAQVLIIVLLLGVAAEMRRRIAQIGGCRLPSRVDQDADAAEIARDVAARVVSGLSRPPPPIY